MSDFTKEAIESRLKIRGDSNLWFGEFDLFVKGFGKSIQVSISLCGNSRTLTDTTIQTVNDVANLTTQHYEHILRLLFDDAGSYKEEAFLGERPAATETGPMSWLRRLFGLPIKYEYFEMAEGNPKHPMFGVKTPADLESIIKWENIFIDDSQETSKRIAFLTCHPPWDVEHGREIAICNGEPVGIDGIELNPYWYTDD
jgi:hypothetical protein